MLQMACKTNKLENDLTCHDKSSASGAKGSLKNASVDSTIFLGTGDRAIFPPQVIMEVKALACELPRVRGLPFSRLSHADIAQEAMHSGITASISGATVWRWLNADAIKPWCYRSWIFPRDPDFAEKAAKVLDLYHGIWEGQLLGPDDHVISADEKTSIQARERIAQSSAPGPRRYRKVEAEYIRHGALAYIAGWDVHRAKIFGVCAQKTGIEPFHQLVSLVMAQEPYRSAKRVFWVTDNGSSHRGQTAINRMTRRHPNAHLVHTPVHASWLNQIEIYFSVLQRKVLTPNDFSSLKLLEDTILDFQSRYEQRAKPFKWKFTKEDMNRVLSKLHQKETDQEKTLIAA